VPTVSYVQNIPGTCGAAGCEGFGKHPPRFRCTDVGNAKWLVYRHGPDIRYAADLQQCFVWSGGRWQRDIDQIGIERFAIETARSIYREV
jgi:hypothetical protein